MAAWLARIITARGWTYHLSEPRYALVSLRALAAKGLARRPRADVFNGQLLDFLFPGDRARDQPYLPDDLFSIIVEFYWGGGMSAEEEAAHAADISWTPPEEEEEESEPEEEPEPGDSADNSSGLADDY